jgi:hypothetical protein
MPFYRGENYRVKHRHRSSKPIQTLTDQLPPDWIYLHKFCFGSPKRVDMNLLYNCVKMLDKNNFREENLFLLKVSKCSVYVGWLLVLGNYDSRSM